MGLESVSVFNVCLWPPQISFFHYNVVYIPNIVLPGLFDEEASTRPVEWLFVSSTNWTMVGADFSSDYWAVWVDFKRLAHCCLPAWLRTPNPPTLSSTKIFNNQAWRTPNPPTHRWELHPLKKPLSTPLVLATIVQIGRYTLLVLATIVQTAPLTLHCLQQRFSTI